MTLTLDYLIFVPEIWVVLAIILVLADLFFGFNYLLLPVGVACFAIAGLVFMHNHGWLPEFIVLENWLHVGYWFTGFLVISVVVLRIFSRSNIRKDDDINQY